MILDVGANASCKARHLEEFAVMGKVYTSAVLHVANPRVGLMSMGEEETKGDDLTREVHEVLKGSTLNFIGNVEGSDVFSGRVDVIVMDGFTGNVTLKVSEKLAETLMKEIKEELMRTPLRKLGRLSRGAPSRPSACASTRRVRGRAAARREGLLRDRPRPVERGGGQARDPGRGRVLHQRRQRADRGRAAGPGGAQGTPRRRSADEPGLRLPRAGRAEGRAWAARWRRPFRRPPPCSPPRTKRSACRCPACASRAPKKTCSSPPTRSPPSSP